MNLHSTAFFDSDPETSDIDKLDIIKAEEKAERKNQEYLKYMLKEMSRYTDGNYEKLHKKIDNFFRNEEEKIKKTQLIKLDYQKVKIFDMAEILKTLSKTSERNLKAVLSKFAEKPSCGYRYLKPADKDFIKSIQNLKKTFPNCVEFLDYIEHFAVLSLLSNSKAFKIPPVLLSGNPGIGKTQIVKNVIKILGVAYRQVDCGALTSPAVLSGSAITYSDSKAGLIVEILRDSVVYANNWILLDEIEKTRRDVSNGGQDMLGCLYSLLEQSSAKEFTDEALCRPVDASHLNYVATANDTSKIDDPLLSRFYVIKINDVTGEQHQIVSQSIYNSLLESDGYKTYFDPKIPSEVLKEIEPLSPREVKTALLRAMAKAAFANKNKKKIKLNVNDFVFDHKKTERDKHIPIGFY